MSSCILCDSIRRAPRRYTSSLPHDGLVVIDVTRRERTLLTVCGLEHRVGVDGGGATRALCVLRDVAVRKWGNAFCIASWECIEPAHWSVFAMPVRVKTSPESEEKKLHVRCFECNGVFVADDFVTRISTDGVTVACPRGCCVAHAHANVEIQNDR